MKYTAILIAFTLSCGDSTTEVYESTQNTVQPPFYPEQNPDAGGAKPNDDVQRPDAGVKTSVTTDKVQALCLSPDPRIDRYARDSARRFGERLEIPMVFGEGCLPILVQEEVYYKEEAQSGLAHFDSPCIWKDCEKKAYILINEASATYQLEWLPNLLDHELGHILSAWGTVLGVDQHLPAGHIMSAANRRDNKWSQEDIDLWCSAAPCGKTRMEASWLSPVSAGVTSYLSSDGLDSGVPMDGGTLPDAN